MSDGVETGVSGAEDPSAQSGTTGSTPEGAGDAGAQSGAEAKPVAETVPKSELEAYRARMIAADKRAGEAEAMLKQLRDKDLPEAEKLKRDYEDTVKEAEKLRTQNRSLSVENAFLKDNKHKWKDPGAALKLVDLSGVDITDDGTVTGLKEALDRLAKTYPWMLDESGEPKPPAVPQAGAPPMNGRAGSDAPDAGKLAQRFPSLRTRKPTTT